MRKIFNILTLFIFFINLGWAQTKPEDKLVTYKALNFPLNEVLKELSQKSDVNIIFSNSKFNSKKTISVNATNEKLGDILAVILKSYKLTYEVVENAIVVVSEKSKEIHKDFTISGTIRDKSNGELLPYATVFLDNKSLGIYANEKGFYSLKLKRGSYKIIYNYLGYLNDTLAIFMNADSVSNIELGLESTALSEVLVREDLSKTSFRYGEDYFSQDKMVKSASLLGEADVLRAIASNAGVSSGSDGFGGLSIRGGNNDQNLVLYDGIPVQNTGHGFGIISIFSNNVVKEARLIKGAVPARYGGRLSSFIDIKTRDGDKTKFTGEVGLSILTSHIALEGPIAKNKSSFLLSYRRTFADIYINTISDGINQSSQSTGNTNYSFHDFNAKLSFDLNSKNQLSLTYYRGGDGFSKTKQFEKKIVDLKFLDQNNNSYNWGNNLIALHWNSQIGNNQYSKFIVFQSNWNNQSFKFERNASDSLNKINDIYVADFRFNEYKVRGIKWDYDYQIKPSNIVRFGLGLNQNESIVNFNLKSNLNNLLLYPKVIEANDLLLSKPFVSKSQEVNGYVEEEISTGKSVVLNVGLHSSFYKIDSISFPSFQPRFSLTLSSDNTWFNISGSYLRQYQQILSENGLGFPSDLWVNTSKFIKPASAYNFSTTLGFLLSEKVALNFGGYYKIMENIIALGEGQGLNAIDQQGDWQKFIPSGKGTAYGGEATFNLSSKLTNLEFNLSYGKSQRQFEDLNNGKIFPYKLDRGFMTNSKLSFKLGNKTEFSLIGTYQGGSKVSFPSGGIFEIKRPGGSILYPEYIGKNNYTFRDYIRLDIAFNFVTKNKIGTHRIFAGVYNALNRKNPIYLQLSRNALDLNTYEASQVSILPVLPALSYTLIF